MRVAHVIPLLFLANCVVETRQGPAAAPPPPPAAAPAPVEAKPAAPAPTAAPAAPAAPVIPGVIATPTQPGTDPLPPSQPPVLEPPVVTTPASPLPNNITDGQPPGMHPNTAPAYWIWRDSNGWWHLRTTSQKGALHRFSGRITPQGAEMMEVRPSHMEFNDRVKMVPHHAWWAFDTAGHLDGFDFRTKGGGQCVNFQLNGDGKEQVFVGAKQVTPPSHHFLLCP